MQGDSKKERKPVAVKVRKSMGNSSSAGSVAAGAQLGTLWSLSIHTRSTPLPTDPSLISLLARACAFAPSRVHSMDPLSWEFSAPAYHDFTVPDECMPPFVDDYFGER